MRRPRAPAPPRPRALVPPRPRAPVYLLLRSMTIMRNVTLTLLGRYALSSLCFRVVLCLPALVLLLPLAPPSLIEGHMLYLYSVFSVPTGPTALLLLCMSADPRNVAALVSPPRPTRCGRCHLLPRGCWREEWSREGGGKGGGVGGTWRSVALNFDSEYRPTRLCQLISFALARSRFGRRSGRGKKGVV